MSEQNDPRTRPPDPAGTQPKFDPRELSLPEDQLALPVGEQVAPEQSITLVEDAFPVVAEGSGATPHGPRFQFVFGALGALGMALVVLAAVLVSRPSPAPPVPWSSWKPLDTGGDPAQQIAEHVGSQYKLPGGQPLVSVSGGPQAVGGQPVVLAVRRSGSSPSALPDNGVFYELCGAGPKCSIPGKASVERGLLVRREALELALYTFRYVGETSQVLVTFPPPPPSAHSKSANSKSSTPSSSSTTETPSHVLLFRPEEVAAELAQPLDKTLSASTPSVKSMNSSPDAHLVDRLTANSVYDSTLTRQESTLVMLLQSPSLGG